MAKTDLRKAGFEEKVIAEATGFADTDDEDILAARKLFAERMAEHKKTTDAEAEQVRAADAPAVRETPVKAASSLQ